LVHGVKSEISLDTGNYRRGECHCYVGQLLHHRASWCSDSQTFSNRYSNQGSDDVSSTSKFFSHFRLKISIAVITHNTD